MFNFPTVSGEKILNTFGGNSFSNNTFISPPATIHRYSFCKENVLHFTRATGDNVYFMKIDGALHLLAGLF